MRSDHSGSGMLSTARSETRRVTDGTVSGGAEKRAAAAQIFYPEWIGSYVSCKGTHVLEQTGQGARHITGVP
jgi:hypothetical protein